MINKTRNIGLDILKASACIAVVTLHVAGNSSDIVNKFLYYFSSFAVPVFFIVNGCLLLNKNQVDFKYSLKKIFNLLKIVLIWNVILSSAEFLLRGKIVNPIATTLNNLIQKEYFWQFWFFGALIIIYLMLPMLNKIFKSTKKAMILTFLFIGICLAIDFISMTNAINGRPIIQVNVIQTFRLWTWFAYFCLGGLLGNDEVRTEINKVITFKKNVYLVIILSVGVVIYEYIVATFIYKIKFAEYFYDNIFMFLWITLIFCLLYRIKNLQSKYLKFVDIMSANLIGVYIIHPTIIRIMNKLYAFDSSISNIILLIIVFGISLVMSMVLNKIKILNKLIKI